MIVPPVPLWLRSAIANALHHVAGATIHLALWICPEKTGDDPMTNVVRLLRNCVVISSGRVTQSTFQKDVGRWFHFISYIDPDGGELQDLETPTRGYARKRAQELATDMGCRVVDRSADESEAA